MRDRLDPHPATEPLAGVLYQSWPRPGGGRRIEYLSSDAEDVLELTAAELSDQLNARTLPLTGVDAGAVYLHFQRSITDHISWRVEVGWVGPRTGRVRWLQLAGFPHRASDGTPYYVGVIIDSTPLKAAEEHSRGAYRTLAGHLDNIPLAAVEWDRDGRIVRWSAQAERVFGWAAGEALGRTVSELGMVHPDDAGRVTAVMRELIGGVAGNVCVNRNVTRDGRVRACEWHNSAVLDEDGRLVSVLSLAQDLTDKLAAEREREALDRQLNEARRYDSLGVLAGGLAHDFNNLLTTILGNAGLARAEAPPGSALAGCLADIEAACQRAANLCSQLTAYAGVGRLAVGPVDLVALLKQAEPVLRAEAGRAALTVRTGAGLPPVTGEAFQIRQAIRNLVTNAGEAVGAADGEVLIEVEETAVPASALQSGDHPLTPPAPGPFLLVRVTDTGEGMAADAAAKAFDPFFSTRFAGRGLGLAAVRGIVKGHKGGIRLRSTPGQGTTVELLFPVAAETAEAVVPLATGSSTLSAPARRGRTGPPPHVLVVDDETNIRELISSLLEDDGMTVDATGDGAEAVRRFAEHPARYSLAVVDLIMPGLNGQDVIRRLRELKPGLPTVVVSGFSDKELPADIRTGGPTAVLPKPFRIEQFSTVVNAALGAKGGPA